MTDVMYADISEFQGNANIATYSTWSDTLCARAHNGYRPDYAFPARLGVMRSAKLRTRIYYQYIVAGGDPVWQARAFMATLGQLQPGEIVMADYEEGTANAIARLRAWFGEVDPWANLRYGGLLYSGESFFNTYLGGSSAWTGRPVCIAKYGQPEPGEAHISWQFTDGRYNGPVNVPGVGYCDVNIHHGTSADLATGLGAPTPGTVPSTSPGPLANPVVAGMALPDNTGYYIVTTIGQVRAFGSAKSHGDLTALHLNAPVVDAWVSPTGNGYTLVAADGGVFVFGDAKFHGSTGSLKLAKPIVAGFPTPDQGGYWLVGGDGGVFNFGDASFDGSEGGKTLNASVVGGASSHDGKGYWLVAADGGVFAFGDAPFKGSTGNLKLAAPVVGMAPTPDGSGYWLVGADGGVFNEGDATFHGSEGGIHLARPVVDIIPTRSGNGYWLFASDGGVFAHGDAGFFGSGQS